MIDDETATMIDHGTATWPELWLTVAGAVRHRGLPTPGVLGLVRPGHENDHPHLARLELTSNEDARQWMRYMDPEEPVQMLEGFAYGHCRWMGWTVIVYGKAERGLAPQAVQVPE